MKKNETFKFFWFILNGCCTMFVHLKRQQETLLYLYMYYIYTDFIWPNNTQSVSLTFRSNASRRSFYCLLFLIYGMA